MVKSLHLTHDQQRLFDQHFPLVHFIIRRYFPRISPSDYDDFVQVGAMGLCRAIVNYDPRKSMLSTYAASCIRAGIRAYIRSLHAACRDRRKEISLDVSFDVPFAADDVESIVIAHEILAFLQRLPSRDLQIIGLRLAGHSQQRISQQLQLSQGYISKRLSAIRQQLRKEVCA